MKTVTKILIAFLLISNTILYAQGEDCTSAVEISDPAGYCSASNAYTNVGSLSSTTPLPVCWSSSTATDDVWFKFTAIGTDVQLTVITGGVDGTIKAPNVALYAGSCSGLSELACSKGIASNNNSLYKNSLSIGTTYLVRISTTTANCGTFKLCITNYTPTITPGADCNTIAKLCNKSEIKVGALSGGGVNNSEIETNSCFNTPGLPTQEYNSAWFQWTCDQAGTLTFNIIPNDPSNDLDFILYELSGTSTNACGTRTILRCTATSCPTLNGMVGLNDTCKDVSEPINCVPPNSDGFLKYLDMVKGKTYVLMVNNFSAASGYRITFGGTGIFAGGNPKAVITASSPTACAGKTILFSGSSSINYTKLSWTFSPNAPDAVTGVGPHAITYSNPGNYTVLLKASDASCTSVTSFNVSILNSPAIPQILDNVPHCEGDTIGPITAKGGTGTFTWFEDVMLTDTIHVGPVYKPVTAVTDTIYVTETANDNGCSGKPAVVIITIVKAIPLPLDEGFEGAVFPPAGWTYDGDPNDTISFKQNKTVGGFGTSTSCLWFDNFHVNLSGNKNQLNLPVYDFSQTTAPVLAFDVAYVRRDSTHSDSLIIIVSDDCSMRRTYTTLYVKGGKDLATVPTDQPNSMFVPTATQWRREIIDMSAFAGTAGIQLAFQDLGHFGQAIYIDNVHIFETATGIHEEGTVPELIVSPNPVVSDVNLNFKTAEALNFTWEISNILGQPIRKESIKNSMGNFNRTIDLRDQPAGIYCLMVTYGSKKMIRKLVKQ